jgi:hypothetical protein
MRHEPRLDADPPRADRSGELRPARRQLAVDRREPRLRCFATRLDGVSRVGEDHDLVATDEELPGTPRGPLLPLCEREPGQVAHVLPTHTEVGVDAGVGKASAEALQPGRPRGTIRLLPTGPLPGGRLGAEVGPRRPCAPGHRHWM